MYTSFLWDSIFSLKEEFEDTEVFLLDQHIPALRLGTADKPAVLAGGFGPEDWQSSVLLLKFFKRLASAAARGGSVAGIAVQKAFEKRSVVVIPCVTPSKMKEEAFVPSMQELMPLADHLGFHPASFFLAVSGESGSLFTPPDKRTRVKTATMQKILAACSALRIDNSLYSPAAEFCRYLSAHSDTTAFLLSPKSLKTSGIDSTYRALEESLMIAALF